MTCLLKLWKPCHINDKAFNIGFYRMRSNGCFKLNNSKVKVDPEVKIIDYGTTIGYYEGTLYLND